MPLLSYFTVVGGAMLASLMVGSFHFPVEPVREARDINQSRIRIESSKVATTPIEIVSRVESRLSRNAMKRTVTAD